MQYQHVVVTRHGGAEVLQLTCDDLPEPRSGEARVKVLATGVAFTDILIREGFYPGIPKVPFSPGYDIAGEIEQLGDGVSGLKIGQRVVALTVIGGYSEYLNLPAEELVPVPDGVDLAEAVSLVLHYVTAYQLLQRMAKVRAGDRVLIHGAGGESERRYSSWVELPVWRCTGRLRGRSTSWWSTSAQFRLITKLKTSAIACASLSLAAWTLP